MTENIDKVEVNKWDGKGALWTLAGVAIAGVAGQFIGAHGGIGSNSVAQAANTTVAYEMAKKDSEIAQLKADAATDKKLVEVYTVLRQQDKDQDAKIANLNTRVTAIETSSPLREQIVLGQVNNVAAQATNGIAALQAQICGINKTLSGITALYVPAASVTPEPMPLKNSWTAPTNPTTGA